MIRTQIYLPREQLKEVKELALMQNTTVSQFVRDSISKNIESIKPKKKIVKRKQNAGSWLLAMARRAEKMHFRGPRDLSTNVDKYLYGKD